MHATVTADDCNIQDVYCASPPVERKSTRAAAPQQPQDSPPNKHVCDNQLPDLSSRDRVFNPIKLGESLCKQFWSCRSALTSFARKSLQDSCPVDSTPSGSLWPVPIPRWSWTAASRLGPRRRRRRHFFHIRHQLLQLTVISLNWEVLGFTSEPPPQGTLGGHMSPHQHEILERIEAMLTHFLCMSPFGTDDLGRSAEKFESVIKALQMELPSCDFRLQDLEECLMQVHGSLNSYSSPFGNHSEMHSTADDPTHRCVFEPSHITSGALIAGAKTVESARVKWENPPSFDPQEFLDPLVRSAYNDPEVLRMPQSLWPKAQPAKMHCTHSEFLKLVSRWDELGACSIIKAADKDFDEAVGIFCVPKDSTFDRLIINPKTINSRMFGYSAATKDLSPGSMLTLLHLPEGKMFRFSADDLTDFYYTFRVPELRSKRNAFRKIFHWQDLQHLQCFKEEHRGHDLLVCLSTLAMGDSLAVEIAQQAHRNVLRYLCNAMADSEALRYRRPIPRSPFVELLAIDDHVGIQMIDLQDEHLNPYLRDSEVFEKAQRAYKQVGLVQHEKKRKRNQVVGTILGADFDGKAGKVMAPRNRIIVLALISLKIASKGTCTPKLLSIMLGCWIHVLLFRRPLFSLIDQLFKEGRGYGQQEIFCLSNRARCELQLLGVLGSMAQGDLRTDYSSKLFCTDASPKGGAVTQADIGPIASQEFWRHTEQRGYYTRLQSPITEILHEKGFFVESESAIVTKDPLPESTSFSIPAPMHEGILYDCLEIFRGSGNWSEAHHRKGLCVHVGIENSGRILRVSDMTSSATFHELTAMALRRVVLDWHAGVPCLSFGTLRRPQVRSKLCPAGFDPLEPFTALHNMLARRTAFILTIALLLGAFISVEQPGSSRMFLLHCYQVLVRLGCVISHYAFCNFGSAFNKPSKWLHNKPWLTRFEGTCSCPHKGNHLVIQGTFTRDTMKLFHQRCRPSCKEVYGCEPSLGTAVSSFSGAYPLRLMDGMASGLVDAKAGRCEQFSQAHHERSLAEVGLSGSSFAEQPVVATPVIREWHEDPEWISELCSCLPFKEVFRYRFKKPGHININESRTYKSFIKAQAKSEPSSRFVVLLDSRVTIGAAAKGRSSSPGITRVLQGSLAYIIGGNLYPGFLHCSSADNKSDGPSRDRDVEGPSKSFPAWLTELQRGNCGPFDAVVTSSRCPKIAARWLRFLLLLAGDIEENPGPVQRGPMDLSVGFVQATSDRMQKCYSGFREWCSTVGELNWKAVEREPQAIAWALRGFGLYLFEQGHPRYLFVYAITACQEYHPECKSFTSVAWQIDKKWQIHEPGTSRSVLPGLIIRAAICLACLWSWKNFAGIVLLGFGAMLHPAEMMALVRKDLIFPQDINYDSPSLFIRVRDPKTARFARRQHGRIDDPGIISFAFAVFGALPLESRLYPASAAGFRRQWNLVMGRLGVPYRQATRGATPGVLRGSGATYLYNASEDISWVAWRGRWSRVRTLEYYLQEVGAYLLIHELSPFAKAKISALSDASWSVIWNTVLAAQ